MVRYHMRITAAALALAVGITGAAQAEPFNIFSASKAQEVWGDATIQDVRHRINPGAAIALGTLGVIAGAAAASHYNRRYYCDPDYEYCGRPRRAARYYYDDDYYYGGPSYYTPKRYYKQRRNGRMSKGNHQ